MKNDDLIYWNYRWDNEGTNVPWETNEVDENLISFIKEKHFNQTLEIGCGTGINSLCISDFSNEVTGIDISSTAIALARNRGKKHNVTFETQNFLDFKIKKMYEFIFDRGCFHHVMKSKIDREIFLNKISHLITDNGYWVSIIGSAESIRTVQGPPRWSISDISTIVEPYLKIIEIKECKLKNKNEMQLPAWAMICQKRLYPLDKDSL